MRLSSHLAFALFVLISDVRGQTACGNTFANFTTCAALNGVPADGEFARVKMTLGIEAEVLDAYSKDNMITRNDACKQAFASFECVKMMNYDQQSFVAGKWVDVFSAPCREDGLRLKPCYEWCLKLQQTCYTRTQTGAEFECVFASAERGGACFGDNGVLGMLPLTRVSSSAHVAPSGMGYYVIALGAACARLR
jgi:hypothetical protein